MNITLIGMAGVGKSVIGRKLAKRLSYTFCDTDELIKKKTGHTLQEIINTSGDDKLLAVEEETILGLGAFENCVLSPGGSVIYSARAMEFIKRNSLVIFLNAPFEVIQGRLVDRQTRGIVGLRKKSLRALFDERLGLYKRAADITIDLPDEFDVDAIVRSIMQAISAGGLT